VDLPFFKYHPDPLSTGSIKPSTNICVICGQVRGYVYAFSVHTPQEYHDGICPWCIADGSAHKKLGAIFMDMLFIGDHRRWEEVSREIQEEVAFQTPGFAGWQSERWFTHCGDAGAFLGRVGYKELVGFGPQAIQAIQDDTGLADEDEWEDFLERLDRDGSPTAYLFQCLHCGAYGGYQDCD
jgi:uncharacterized protein CbrC (UPF0167 family)